MNDEALVIEEMQVTPGEETQAEEAPEDLQNFDYLEYTQHIPDKIHEALVDMLSNKKYGWKSRARTLLYIEKLTQDIQRVKDSLVEMTTGKRTRGPNKINPRDGLRAFFNSLSEEKLQRACSMYSVNYNSFAGDKANLIEALCDEAELVD